MAKFQLTVIMVVAVYGITRVVDSATVVSSRPSGNQVRCGIGKSARISNGQSAAANQFPWMVRIEIRSSPRLGFRMCAGSLLDSQHVLTSGRCVLRHNRRVPSCQVTVISGSSQLFSETMVESSVAEIKLLPRDSRIAVLRLNTQLTLDQSQSPVCLPTSSIRNETKNCLVMGWGVTSMDDMYAPDFLQYAHVTTTPTDKCATRLGDLHFLKRGFLCAGGQEKNICVGDEGSSLVCFDNKSKHYTQYGVALNNYYFDSSHDCAKSMGIFVDLAPYRPWLEHIMGQTTEIN